MKKLVLSLLVLLTVVSGMTFASANREEVTPWAYERVDKSTQFALGENKSLYGYLQCTTTVNYDLNDGSVHLISANYSKRYANDAVIYDYGVQTKNKLLTSEGRQYWYTPSVWLVEYGHFEKTHVHQF